MNLTYPSKTRRVASRGATVKTLAAIFGLGALLAASAQAEMFRPVMSPGGINVRSNLVINSIVVRGNEVVLEVGGLQAPYDVQKSTNLVDWFHGAYTSLKWPEHTGVVVVSNVASGTFFRLNMLGLTNYGGRYVNYTDFAGISNVFVGVNKCNGCHGDKVTEWSGTAHATAINRHIDTNGVIPAFNLQNCVVCHSVGRGQPGGFLDLTNTPQLASVGCEACHGPANAHVNISGREYHPVSTLAPEVCGGCHTGSHHPTYDEYMTSRHREVSIDVSYGVASGTGHPETINVGGTNWYGYVVATNGTTNMAAGIVNSLNPVSGWGRAMSCGACHSGATRAAMIADYEARQRGQTNYLALPHPADGAEWGPTCANCHDPHSAAKAGQLRNPIRSTNYFTLFTGSVPPITNYWTNVFGQAQSNIVYRNDGFASQYNPNIQVCAQCHNSRGARWDGRSLAWNAASNSMVMGTSQSFSRPPHHSPQYNMLIGIVQDDYLNRTVNVSSAHAGLSSTSGNTNQCVACHVPRYAVSSATNVTGHTFELDVKGCALAGCHTSYSEAGRHAKVEERQFNASNSLARIVSLLNQWATTKGPALGLTKGANNWEYTIPGILASSGYGVNGAGPSSAQQLLIPDAIKQARFNLYMVQHDGSMGVHNYTYTDYLIRAADTNVTSQFPSANFRATSTAGFAPFAVTFTNLGTGVTNYSWDFGDGVGTSTSANPSYTYTNPGIYNVTFTANGTETITRTAYIRSVIRPVVSFTANQTTVAVGTPVTFTNLSTSITDVGLWRWTFNLTNSSTRLDSGFTPTATYTYTNTGTFSVSLRASTPAGSVTKTNAAYIIVTP